MIQSQKHKFVVVKKFRNFRINDSAFYSDYLYGLMLQDNVIEYIN